ncbi:glutathione S-transferase N-terminal domain-containing protein [Rhodospirillaceae bacterium SYSU D60014]|uniref:glutathione S-transferase family protein n=1 Tax=Virgifigura deserti TaxID=2268457 RepID=UPI000E661831
MIDFYTSATPNGRKVAIMLEETALPYRVHRIDLGAGDQHRPGFLKLNSNNKIPVIHDPDTGVTLAESSAILIYLAEKTGQFQPESLQDRYETLQWVMFQMASVGPMMGQLWWFRRSAPEEIPLAIDRYEAETKRIFSVLDGRLAGRSGIAGDYGIADIATWPWIDAHRPLGIDIAAYPNLARWYAAVGARPAVQRGMAVPAADAPRAFPA